VTQADAIVKALRALDTANDNHWTVDGQPRLDIVKNLAADQSITRDMVTLALPGFTRTKARELAETPAAPPPPPTAQAPVSAPQPQSPPAQGVATPAPAAPAVAAPIPVEEMSREQMISALQEELADAEADTEDARKALEHMKKLFEDARKHEDSIRVKLDGFRSKHDNTNAIQDYLASQRALLDERGQRRRMVAEAGVNLRELSKAMSAAPIDQAMARRTGRGGSRPKFPKA
jgi:hypothetical protein